MNRLLIYFSILVLAIGLTLFINIKNEGFSNFTLEGASGLFPSSQTTVLVQDTYPAIGKNQVSNKSANTIWQEYPVFELGSYAQVTNNIRYPDNPDNGRCTPATFCNALYENKNIGSNQVTQLPPLNPECGTRVGYFDTGVNLLPYRTNMANILY